MMMVLEVGRLLMLLSLVYVLRGVGDGVSASLESDGGSRGAAVGAAAAAGGYKGRSAGHCERITIPLCLDMKYNMTRMPNLVGHSTQAEAAMQVCHSVSAFVGRRPSWIKQSANLAKYKTSAQS